MTFKKHKKFFTIDKKILRRKRNEEALVFEQNITMKF